ncbi:Nitrogen permease regulator 2 [Blyttiomyces sp. JEL0837]|nr:Nitrogen permease regulator 2 [Blyttiomyces sp. JEL0837]
MWEAAVEPNKYTLMFPPDEERVFLREHSASEDGRKLTIGLILMGTIYIIVYAGTSALFSTDDIDPFQYWILSSKGYQDDIERFPLAPGYIVLYLGLLFDVFRSETFIYIYQLYEWRPSQLCLYFGMMYSLVGVTLRTGAILPLALVLNICDAVQNFLVISQYPEALSALRFIGNMMPGVVFHMVSYGRGYHTEISFRTQFSGMKRAQGAIQKVTLIEQTMNSLLENILPQSVIPRLIASNYQFSTVTDRIPHAYCIFVDFFHGNGIKTLEPAVAASTLNDTFSKFDEILVDFPMLEKIKTVGSKCMLMAVKATENTAHGVNITKMLDVLGKGFMNPRKIINKRNRNSRALTTNIKVGTAFGSVIAGVVGNEKLCYDIYSDTVNCASRMANLEFANVACTAEAYHSFDIETQKLWQSKGMHQIKGKGIMEIFEFRQIEDDFEDLPTPKASLLRKEANVTLSNLSPGIPYDEEYQTSAMPMRGRRATILWTPAADFAKAAEERELDFFKSTDNYNIRRISTMLNSRQSSRIVSRVDRSIRKDRVAPMDTSKYLNSVSILDLDNQDDISNGLQTIIDDLSHLLTTSTTDNLIPMLSKYIIAWKLKFQDPQIERLYRQRSRQRLNAFILQHTRLICFMMVTFAVISGLYEAFLVGQVGLELEEAMRNGTSQAMQESSQFQIERFVSLGFVILAAVLELLCLFVLSSHISKFNDGKNKSYTHQKRLAAGIVKNLITYFGASDKVFLSHIQYVTQLFVIILFGLPLLCWSTYSKAWFAPGAINPMLDCSISFTTRMQVDFPTRFFSSILLTTSLCILRTLVTPMLYAEWMFSYLSVLTSMFVVYRSEYAERIGFLLEETLQSSQEAFDRRAFLSAGLLKAVLPRRIIGRLTSAAACNSGEMHVVEHYQNITILHLDVVSFTVLSSTLEPHVLIEMLNSMFSTFDQICKSRNVEKILTIGDAYVAASLGKPDSTSGHILRDNECLEGYQQAAAAVCHVAVEMQSAMKVPNTVYSSVQIRVGIHTGPASGFITGKCRINRGLTKLKYELIGETVDIAEKVQEKSSPGTVFASETTVSMLPVGAFDIQKVNSKVHYHLQLFQIWLPASKSE